VFDASSLIEDCIVFEPDREIAAGARQARQHARSIRTRSRIRSARAKSQAMLAEILPPVIAPSDAWHILSAGDVDSLSFVGHLLAAHHADHLILSTWCMSIDDVRQLAEWLRTGRIKALDLYVGEIFPSQYTQAFEELCALLRDTGAGRVAVYRNHSNVTVLANHASRYYVTVESSANLNTNPRAEQTVITRSRPLAHFYKHNFDSVRSIVRNFDNWTPNGWPATKAKRTQAH